MGGEAAPGVGVEDGVAVDGTAGQGAALCRSAFCCGAAGHGADDAAASFGDVLASAAIDPGRDAATGSLGFVGGAASAAEGAGGGVVAATLTEAVTSPPR